MTRETEVTGEVTRGIKGDSSIGDNRDRSFSDQRDAGDRRIGDQRDTENRSISDQRGQEHW